LAALEFLVHTDSDLLPADLISLSADVPDDLRIEKIDQADLPKNWTAYPPPHTIQAIGSEWVERGQTVMLSVPSVVIPGESNYLLNPKHRDFTKVKWSAPVPFRWDQRLLRK
jgi:RES domain-containing protein